MASRFVKVFIVMSEKEMYPDIENVASPSIVFYLNYLLMV